MVIGPPRCGKTYFIEKYLKRENIKVEEEIIGLSRELELEHENLKERLKQWFKKVAHLNVVKKENLKDELYNAGFEREEADEILKFDVSEDYLNHLIGLKKSGKYVLVYYIPKDFENDAIKNFSDQMENLKDENNKTVKISLKWMGVEYVPVGLIELMKDQKRFTEQLIKYKEINKKLGINVEEGVVVTLSLPKFAEKVADFFADN